MIVFEAFVIWMALIAAYALFKALVVMLEDVVPVTLHPGAFSINVVAVVIPWAIVPALRLLETMIPQPIDFIIGVGLEIVYTLVSSGFESFAFQKMLANFVYRNFLTCDLL